MQLDLDAFLFIGSSITHMEAKLKLLESDDGDEDLSPNTNKSKTMLYLKMNSYSPRPAETGPYLLK